MSIIISFLVGVAAGAVGGILAYRNNIAKAQNVEAKGKGLLDALKGQ
jgi:hypothetical protein